MTHPSLFCRLPDFSCCVWFVATETVLLWHYLSSIFTRNCISVFMHIIMITHHTSVVMLLHQLYYLCVWLSVTGCVCEYYGCWHLITDTSWGLFIASTVRGVIILSRIIIIMPKRPIGIKIIPYTLYLPFLNLCIYEECNALWQAKCFLHAAVYS